MKIAVASEGNLVTQHFGHCANFNVFESENGKIVGSMSIQNGEHQNGCVPDFLTESGVKLIITGGIGGGAVENLKRKGIDVIMGANGDAKAAAEAYFSGALQSNGVLCSAHHDHHEHGHDGHTCGGHESHGDESHGDESHGDESHGDHGAHHQCHH